MLARYRWDNLFKIITKIKVSLLILFTIRGFYTHESLYSRVSHNYTFSSILMGAQVFPIPSYPLRPNIAKKSFSGNYTSDICHLPYFAKIRFFAQYLKKK
jgi:hypothetical protein